MKFIRISSFTWICGLISFIFSLILFQKIFINLVEAQNVGPQLLLYTNTTALPPNDTFQVKLGVNSLTHSVTAVDAIITFDSSLITVSGVTLGNTDLKSMTPQDATQVFDLSKALIIDPDPTKSRLEIGLVAFDPITQLPTTPLPAAGNFDPQTNPLATIQFTTKISGTTSIGLKFDGSGTTTDSNIVTNDLGNPQDVLAAISNNLSVSIVPLASPQPSPIVCNIIDFNQNHEIDVFDIMQVSTRWNTQTGDANYNAIYDLDNSSQINIIDIQLVSGRWLEQCGAPQV